MAIITVGYPPNQRVNAMPACAGRKSTLQTVHQRRSSMRKSYLVGAIACALWGSSGLLAAETAAPAPTAEPATPETSAKPPEALRTMTPEERRAFRNAEHEKFRAQVEAAAPSPPPPQPMSGAAGAPEPTSPEQRAAEMEKLRAMTPEDRRAAMYEAHAKMREQMRQAMPPAEPPPPASPAPEGQPAATPTAAAAVVVQPAHRTAEDRPRQMTPEEQRAYRNQRYEDLRERAAALGMDMPELPPWEARRQGLTQEEIAEYKARMRKITPEERTAYRLEHYQKLRERAKAAGLELPENPPWQDPDAFSGSPPASTAEMERLQQEIGELQGQLREETAKMRETMRAMRPEDRHAIFEMYRPRFQEMWENMPRPMDQWRPAGPPMSAPGYGPEQPPQGGWGQGYGPAAPNAVYPRQGYGYPQGYGYGTGYPGYGR
jgi:hypothetical protein